jgi:hypothetical protein
LHIRGVVRVDEIGGVLPPFQAVIVRGGR